MFLGKLVKMKEEYKLNDDSKVINIGIPSLKTIAQKKGLIQFLLMFTLSLFFFNFFTISCNSNDLVCITGFNLVVGTNVSNQLEKSLTQLTGVKSFDEEGNIINTFSKQQQQEAAQIAPNFFAILSFGFLMITFFALFFKFPYADAVVVILLLIAFLSLFILGISFGGILTNKSNDFMQIVVTNNLAYWLALIMTLLVLYICFIMYRYDLY